MQWMLWIGLKFPKSLFAKPEQSVLAVNGCFAWKIILEAFYDSVSNSLKDEMANELPSSVDYAVLGWVANVIHLQ